MITDIDILGFLVDFRRIYPARQDKRSIHRSSTVLGQERTREVYQAIKKQHNAVFITIALPGKDTIRDKRMIVSNGQAVNSFFRSGTATIDRI